MGKDLKGKELGKGIYREQKDAILQDFTSKTGKRKTLYDFKLNELNGSCERFMKKNMV